MTLTLQHQLKVNCTSGASVHNH